MDFREKIDFLVKVAEFHTKNLIFKVKYLSEWQKKRNQKLQQCAYSLISGQKLLKTHHSALL